MPSSQGSQNLSSKDLSMLEDLLNYEYLAAKVCAQHAGQLTDSALSSLATNLASKHHDKFNDLMKTLKQY